MLEVGAVLDGHVRLEERIGRGGQGEVWRVREVTPENRELAAKLYVMPFSSRTELSRNVVENEIRKLSLIVSNFVVLMLYAIYHLDKENDQLIIGYTMQLANAGTLDSNRTFRTHLKTDNLLLLRTVEEISRGLSAIHSANTIHSDIKPSNVLLFKEGNIIYSKISDLGAAYIPIVERSIAWDPRYAAPERFGGGGLRSGHHKSDIYSLGMVFFELVAGDYPYSRGWLGTEPGMDEQRFADMHLKDQPKWELFSEKHNDLKNLIAHMMEKDQSERPDIDKVINILERMGRETLVDTRGSRIENVFFPRDRFSWNPKLHRILNFKRKIYFLKTSKPIEDFERISNKIRAVTEDGFTMYVAYGSKDIVLLCWEGPGGYDFGGILKQYANDLDYEPIDAFEAQEIIFGGNTRTERWEKLKSNEILDEIIDNTSKLGEPDLESWFQKNRYILGSGDIWERARRVRLLLKITSVRTMREAERESLTESLDEVLRVSFEKLRGADRHGYTYRIYSHIRSEDPDEHGRNIFSEIIGKDLFWCSQCVVAVIREMNRRRLRADQRYFYSSHIQFSPELMLESEDGNLAKVLAERKVFRPTN